MFKYTLAATLDEMDREGITVAECPLGIPPSPVSRFQSMVRFTAR